MTSPLRILVVLPMYGGSLPIGRYCATALRAMGHSVRIFDAPFLYPAFTGIRKLDLTPRQAAPLENAFLQVVSQAIWSQAQPFEPHLVLALAQAPVSKSLLQRLRHAGARSVMWFVEDYNVFQYWRTYAPLYDAFAIIQKEPFVSELQKAGQPHSLYLPLAALPEFHRPLRLSPDELREYGADIAFLGAGYPNRRLAFRPLAGRNFKIWGSDWDGESLLARNIQRNGQRVSEEEGVKIYNATKVNLNLHSSIRSDVLVSHGDFVNPRTFELASMRAFQFVDKRSLLAELFAPDELATFDNTDSFYEGIEYFLAKPEERRAFAERAQKRVLAEHTYAHRMRSLLDYLEREYGPWTGAGGGQDETPPEVRPYADEISALLQKLQLGPRASFEDVLARLRQQSGALDDLETSLLFLDELRRQYKR